MRGKVLWALVLWILPSLILAQAISVPLPVQTQPFATASLEEIETALRTARIVKVKELGTGVTKPLKLTLDNGQFEFHACYKNVDERRFGVTKMENGIEVDFKDSWKFEIAAYELDKLLGLGMIPVTVERSVQGKEGSVQMWVENSMTEKQRKEQSLEPPDTKDWNRQIAKIRIFDNLIYNIDRNLGNVLITSDWRIYMIDHSRSFKIMDEMKSSKELKLFSISFMNALRNLDELAITARCGKYLSPMEIRSVLQRRDLILQFYDQQKAAQGAAIEFP
jgi:hypothetical protein